MDIWETFTVQYVSLCDRQFKSAFSVILCNKENSVLSIRQLSELRFRDFWCFAQVDTAKKL